MQLRIERVSDRDMKIRDLYVTIDDLPERTLEFGDSLELELPPGEHLVRATNRLFTSRLPVSGKAGERVVVEAANTQKAGVLNVFTFIGGGLIYRPILWLK